MGDREMKKNKDLVNNFWNEYWNADSLKRLELIKKTDCFKRLYEVMKSRKIDLKTKEYIFNQKLQSYFDDLLLVMER